MSSIVPEAQRRQLHEQFDELLNRLPAKLEGAERAESGLTEGLRRLGQQTMQAWAESASTASAPPDCPQCEQTMRHRGLPRCTVVTTFGPITFRRPRRRCDRCEEELYPHDARLRFLSHGVSWPLARIVAGQMALLPSEQVQGLLIEDHDVELSKETIQAIAYDAAREVFGEGTDEAKSWATERLAELWDGDHRQTRRELAALRKRLRAKSKREALRKLTVYLKKQRGADQLPGLPGGGVADRQWTGGVSLQKPGRRPVQTVGHAELAVW